MSDCNCSPQRDNRHHRRSRSCSPGSAGSAGETPAEREERQLVEAAVPFRLPAEQPQAAPTGPEQPVLNPAPAEEAVLAVQTSAPTAPPPEATLDAQGAKPRPPVHRRYGGRALSGSQALCQGLPRL